MGLSAGSIMAPCQQPTWISYRMALQVAPLLGNMHKTHRGPSFSFFFFFLCGYYKVTAWAEIWAISGFVHGFHVGPSKLTHLGFMQDFTGL